MIANTSSPPYDQSVPPKRCRTAYNIFYQIERVRILASLPESKQPVAPGRRYRRDRRPPHGKIAFQDLSKRISLLWKALSKADRAHYTELAKRDKERYMREKAAWQESVEALARFHASDTSLEEGPEDSQSEKRELDLEEQRNRFSLATIVPNGTPTVLPFFSETHSPDTIPPVDNCARSLPEHSSSASYSVVERESLAMVASELGPAGCDLLISLFGHTNAY